MENKVENNYNFGCLNLTQNVRTYKKQELVLFKNNYLC